MTLRLYYSPARTPILPHRMPRASFVLVKPPDTSLYFHFAEAGRHDAARSRRIGTTRCLPRSFTGTQHKAAEALRPAFYIEAARQPAIFVDAAHYGHRPVDGMPMQAWRRYLLSPLPLHHFAGAVLISGQRLPARRS